MSAYGVRVLCADELPTAVRAGCFVVNTDHCGNVGKHWTVFYFPKGDKPAEIFDSLGRAPGYYHSRFEHMLIANRPRYKYLRDRLQAMDSKVCGQYCIYYVEQQVIYRLTDLKGLWIKLFRESNPRGILILESVYLHKSISRDNRMYMHLVHTCYPKQ